jgi:hypothetical protein
MKRLHAFVKKPRIYSVRWWRARRYSKAVARRLHAEHIEWAQSLATEIRKER